MFWASVGFLSLIVTGLVLYPLARRRVPGAGQTAHSVDVYRQQLEELDHELSRGLLTEKQAAIAKAEIGQRIAEAADPALAVRSGLGAIGRGLTAAAIALGLPAGAMSFYLYLGMPDQPDRPLAQRTEELELFEHARRFEEYSEALAARLEKDPGDANGWAMLGRVHRALGRFAESAEAFARAHALRPEAANAAADHAEALVHASNGFVSEAAENMLTVALGADPNHVKARFYLGSALAQRPDDIPRAIELWSSLEKDSPPDAPWLEALRQNIRVAKAELAAITQARQGAAEK